MGQGTLGKVRAGSRDPWGGPGKVRGHTRLFGTGRGTFGEVRDGSGEPQGGS